MHNTSIIFQSSEKDRKGRPTIGIVSFASHQHTIVTDRPIGVIQEAGVNLNSEHVVFWLNHLHQWLRVIWDVWVFMKKKREKKMTKNTYTYTVKWSWMKTDL